MSIVVEVRRNTYQDSVTLMRLSSDLLAEDGVTNASIMMGTAGNIEIMREGGLDAPALNDARPTDLVIAIVAASEDAARTAIEKAIAALNTERSFDGKHRRVCSHLACTPGLRRLHCPRHWKGPTLVVGIG